MGGHEVQQARVTKFWHRQNDVFYTGLYNTRHTPRRSNEIRDQAKMDTDCGKRGQTISAKQWVEPELMTNLLPGSISCFVHSRILETEHLRTRDHRHGKPTVKGLIFA